MGSAYEHGSTFALALIVGYLITVITQIYKDRERFMKQDFDQRIELCKIKLKYQQRQETFKEQTDAPDGGNAKEISPMLMKQDQAE